MIFAIEGSDWKRTWRNSGLTGIQTLAFEWLNTMLYYFIYFNSCYFHYQEYYILTMACSPVGFFISMDRALCLVVTKVMVWFLVNPENFQVISLFLPLSRCLRADVSYFLWRCLHAGNLSQGIIFSRSIQIVLRKCNLRFFLPFWIIYCCSTHLICCTATRGKQSNYFLIFHFVLAKSGSGHHSFLLLSREDSSMVCKQAQVVEQT